MKLHEIYIKKRNKQMAENIVLMKLYNGDYIIGEDVGLEGDDITTLKSPRLVVMMPTMTGSMGIALKPICFPFANKRLMDSFEVHMSHVMYVLYDELGEIEKDIVNGYKSEVSGLKIATPEEAAAYSKASDIII